MPITSSDEQSPGVPAPESDQIQEVLNGLRRIRRMEMHAILLFLLIPVTFATLAVIGTHVPSWGLWCERIMGVLLPLEFLAFGIQLVRFSFVRCPRCTELFFMRRGYGSSFARKCLHCGLHRFPKPREDLKPLRFQDPLID